MADPMTPERLAEIREEIDLGTGVLSEKTALELLAEVERLRAELEKARNHRDYLRGRLDKRTKEAKGRKAHGDRLRAELDDLAAQNAKTEDNFADFAEDALDIQRERDRLRAELAAFVPPGTLSAGETPALCGTCTERLCVPGLPGCARCVAAELDAVRSTVETLSVRLQAALDDKNAASARFTNQYAAVHLERDGLRAERDRLAEQVQHVRDRHPRKTDDADCMDADTTLGCQHGPGYHVVEYCGTCDEEWPCAEIRALDGTEAGS